MEILLSNRLKKAWIHKSVNLKPKRNIEIFGDEVEEIEATLQKTCFKMEEVKYCAKVLGEFNAENLAVAIKVATELGLTPDEIKRGLNRVSPVPHRLQKINAGGKIILDDGFNGNIDGVLASFKLVSQHQGRKVLVTPGLVEVNRELNEEVAKRANEIFDLIIVTGELNKPIFEKFIDEDKLILLPDKSQLQETLQTQTYERDLILFSNDAPSFV
jgi:UDP-N-acetylmuramoyl-tripeptide--D-alanyl-D-alanine ligase